LRGFRRAAWAGIGVAGLALGSPAAAQTFTPNTVLLSPAPGRFLAEAELSWNRPRAFVTEPGVANDFPGSLGFWFAVLRLSNSPLPHFSAGLELPFRSYRFWPNGFERAVSGSGIQGLGVFGDWHPSGPDARVSFEARAEVFFAFDGHANPLSTSDGVNRYLTAFQVLSGTETGLLPGWRLDAQARVELEWGPNSEPEDHYAEWNLQAHGGPRVAKVGPAEILVLAVGGYRRATGARQEGNIFRTSASGSALAGGLVEVSWPGQAPAPGAAVELSVTREFGLKNALDGWRGTLSLRHAF
jgi:hypothetical protein